jgi:glycosyltransferase involved in cell wall biosynthesis
VEIESPVANQNVLSLSQQSPDIVRRRVGIIIPGGIGTGSRNIGIPVLEQLTTLLGSDIDITVFSLFKVNEDYVPKNFVIRGISGRNAVVKYLRLFWCFRQLHRQNPFDVIHGYWALPSGFLAVVIGRIFRVKSVVSILGGDAASLPSIGYGQLRGVFQRNLVMWTLHHADERTALTQYSVNHLVRSGLKKPIKVIPWGVDPAMFSWKEKAIEIPVQFLHVANLTPVKDQSTLLRAFKLISQEVSAELTIIGEGPLEEGMRSLANILGVSDKVRFMGLQPYDQLPFYYHASVILLHTSLSEGQSEVVTEAMSCGLLVCGTRVGLMADLPEACLAVDPEDFQSLANQVIGALKDRQLMNQFRYKAREWTVAHSIHWTAGKIKDLYES